jgi:hypothetical protein
MQAVTDGPRAGNKARLVARFPTASAPIRQKCRAERQQKHPLKARTAPMDLQKTNIINVPFP